MVVSICERPQKTPDKQELDTQRKRSYTCQERLDTRNPEPILPSRTCKSAEQDRFPIILSTPTSPVPS